MSLVGARPSGMVRGSQFAVRNCLELEHCSGDNGVVPGRRGKQGGFGPVIDPLKASVRYGGAEKAEVFTT